MTTFLGHCPRGRGVGGEGRRTRHAIASYGLTCEQVRDVGERTQDAPRHCPRGEELGGGRTTPAPWPQRERSWVRTHDARAIAPEGEELGTRTHDAPRHGPRGRGVGCGRTTPAPLLQRERSWGRGRTTRHAMAPEGEELECGRRTSSTGTSHPCWSSWHGAATRPWPPR